jgi:hypothetical protein
MDSNLPRKTLERAGNLTKDGGVSTLSSAALGGSFKRVLPPGFSVKKFRESREFLLSNRITGVIWNRNPETN